MNVNHIAPLRGTVSIRCAGGVADESDNINLCGQLLAGSLINSRVLVLQGQVRLIAVQVRETVSILGRPVIGEVGTLSQAILRSGTVNAYQGVVIIDNIERLFNSEVLSINDSLIRVRVSDLLSLQLILSRLSLIVGLESGGVLSVRILLSGFVLSLNLLILGSDCFILFGNLSVLSLDCLSFLSYLSGGISISLSLSFRLLILLNSSHSLLQRLNLRSGILLSFLSLLNTVCMVSSGNSLSLTSGDLDTLLLGGLSDSV